MTCSPKLSAFLKVGFAFFIWSLSGPILNLSSFSAIQTIWGISILAVIYLLFYSFFNSKISELKVVKLNMVLLIFLLASGLSGVLWLQSLTLVPIAQAVLLYSVVPIFTFVLGFLFLKEGLQLAKAFALTLGIVGVTIILLGDFGKLTVGTKFFFGTVAILAAAFLNAIQAVIAKKLSLNYPTWITVLLIMLAQVVIATPFAFSQKWEITPFAVSGVIFLSIFSSIVAFFFYVNGFKILKSSTVTLAGYLEPFLAAIWGYLFLRQIVTANIFLGGILILASGYIAVRSEER